MTHIADYEKYNQLMKAGMYDKLFFVDKVFDDCGTIVDFGCADGMITREIAKMFPNCKVIGYDNDPTMIEKAKGETVATGITNITFTSDMDLAKEGTTLYLSSIIHEVYSYRNSEEIDEFWDFVFNSNFKTIIIRDMLPDEEINRTTDKNTVRKVYSWCFKNGHESYLKSFEGLNGKIDNYKNLIHFLLKYQYTHNWDREVRENYLPISIQDLYRIMPIEYRIDYQENLTLPYYKHQWEKDFGFFIDENIHAKLILRKL